MQKIAIFGLWYNFEKISTLGFMTKNYNLWMSRLRLIETEKFLGCRDQDSSRQRNFFDVNTKTRRD